MLKLLQIIFFFLQECEEKQTALRSGIAMLVNEQKYFLFADVAYFVQQTCISNCLAKNKKIIFPE